MSLWLLASMLFRVMFCSLSYCCVKWILSSIVITLLGKRDGFLPLICGLYTVCFGLFALSLTVIGRLCLCVCVAHLRHHNSSFRSFSYFITLRNFLATHFAASCIQVCAAPSDELATAKIQIAHSQSDHNLQLMHFG